MHPAILEWVQQQTQAKVVQRDQVIQSLWSGYGEIIRLRLQGAAMPSVVLKHIRFPDQADHPHGWHSDFSHQRKIKSYAVETVWYTDFSQRCDQGCRVASCYGTASIGDEHVILLEDLDTSNFSGRKTWLNLDEAKLCLRWLAHFHAIFLGSNTQGLWPIGSYWHLATRPDEWQAMPENALKHAAQAIDQALNHSSFQTLIHGDAKVANFCFSDDETSVAAVDFQYVGGGCGMKDVAYMIGSCLDEQHEIAWEHILLDDYFQALSHACKQRHKNIDIYALEKEWRMLFPVAQADFSRFLAGWRPEHWKVNAHNSSIAQNVAVQYLHTETNTKP